MALVPYGGWLADIYSEAKRGKVSLVDKKAKDNLLDDLVGGRAVLLVARVLGQVC